MMKRFAAVLLAVILSVAALAAQAGGPPPKPAAQDEFVPVDSPANVETIPAARLVGLAYGFIWVVLFGYVWTVRTRLARVEREMEAVGRSVAARKP